MNFCLCLFFGKHISYKYVLIYTLTKTVLFYLKSVLHVSGYVHVFTTNIVAITIYSYDEMFSHRKNSFGKNRFEKKIH